MKSGDFVSLNSVTKKLSNLGWILYTEYYFPHEVTNDTNTIQRTYEKTIEHYICGLVFQRLSINYGEYEIKSIWLQINLFRDKNFVCNPDFFFDMNEDEIFSYIFKDLNTLDFSKFNMIGVAKLLTESIMDINSIPSEKRIK